MSGSEAILVGEAWISEHYFTSDARASSFLAKVLERRAYWDSEAGEQRPTARTRFLAARQSLEALISGLPEASEASGGADAYAVRLREVQERVLDVLGLRAGGLRTHRVGPLVRVSLPGIVDRAPLAVVLATSLDSVEQVLARDAVTLPEPVALTEDSLPLTSAARLVSALFVGDDAPDLVLVLAGRWAVLAERERWAEGRYLAVDLQLVCERNDTRRGGEIDRALTCLSAESIAPDADGELWWHGVLEESVKHTVGVSQDLRDGVRASIEILANDVVRRRRERGLAPLPEDQAQVLAVQCLRFLYRILFLLYAEASPELGVLPVGERDYEAGYSLDRLRDLVQTELVSPKSRSGTHFYDSLGVLFGLIDRGHAGETRNSEQDREAGDDGGAAGSSQSGLTFHALRADLFRPGATAHLDAVGLGNAELQRVLQHLLLSKEKRGRDRGFLSYAELGISQLGAVYEGLMSYTGFFAEDDLYEVAKGGDGSKGSWVVPVGRAQGIADSDFVRDTDPVTGESRPVLHPRGSFVYRLAGRERQQSASYYTPEVLTRFTVGQALEELLDGDGTDGEVTPAAEILDLTICEPALGSGAFAIEAVRQLAEQYLSRRQKELGERIDPDDYPRRLQEVKAYLALHNVYGVDLNATAVELAEISLWLDTMVAGLDAPWFGLHLRRGNSLVGARRAVHDRRSVSDKSWLTQVPRDLPLSSLVADLADERVGGGLDGGVHSFLLPAEGWGASADAREARDLAPEAVTALREWRRGVRVKPTRAQIDALVELAHRVEVLWQIAYRRLAIAESEIRRAIPVWGMANLPSGGSVQREQIEAALRDANGAYARLRRVMDAWCALWFWPLTEDLLTVETAQGSLRAKPPSLDGWIEALRGLLGRATELKREAKTGQAALASAADWESLNIAEEAELSFAFAAQVDEVLAKHPWLVVCERVAAQQGFFHWELDFAPVFGRSGFDLQVGNPPWVRPRSDLNALLAEGDPWWQLQLRPSQAEIAEKRKETLALPGMLSLVTSGMTDIAVLAAFLGSVQEYLLLQGLQPDLYRCFMTRMWQHASPRGRVGMISLESHFTDEQAGILREELYLRLRRHWHFVNELQLFEIQDQKQYGVTVSGSLQTAPDFLQASWLYHPDTAVRSLHHDGSGPEPGLKDAEGKWDLRPHADRIVLVTDDILRTWHEVLENASVAVRRTRMVHAVNRSASVALQKLSHAPRVGALDLRFSPGWHESADRKKGYFETRWGANASWDDVILQGPHLYVGNPMYKAPNESLLHHLDWSGVDLETLARDAVPVTGYKPAGDRYRYDCDYTDWGDVDDPKPARDYYRIAWRRMAANTGERTLIPCIVPPGVAHVDGVVTAGQPEAPLLPIAVLQGLLGSLTHDFMVRVVPKGDIRASVVNRLPHVSQHFLAGDLVLRVLRLNCLTDAYADLWQECYSPDFQSDTWTRPLDHAGAADLGDVGARWTPRTPLRLAADRRQALLEIDALVALMLDLTADELCSIYRTQFPVLYGYDRNTSCYDAHGRLVPTAVLTAWRRKGDRVSEQERTARHAAGTTYTYELPFGTLDREADMRQAYAHFERAMAQR